MTALESLLVLRTFSFYRVKTDRRFTYRFMQLSTDMRTQQHAYRCKVHSYCYPPSRPQLSTLRQASESILSLLLQLALLKAIVINIHFHFSSGSVHCIDCTCDTTLFPCKRSGRCLRHFTQHVLSSLSILFLLIGSFVSFCLGRIHLFDVSMGEHKATR